MIGETFAFNQSSGNSPVSMDFWKICCNYGGILSVHSFSTALCGFNSFNSLKIPWLVNVIGATDGDAALLFLGKLWQSSWVKTDWNWLFRPFAYSRGDAAILLRVATEATPVELCLRLFIHVNLQNGLAFHVVKLSPTLQRWSPQALMRLNARFRRMFLSESEFVCFALSYTFFLCVLHVSFFWVPVNQGKLLLGDVSFVGSWRN